jgi:class 3 adenylate cyclase
MVIGRTVDIAAFLQREAEPNVPLIDAPTAVALRPTGQVGRLVRVSLKGVVGSVEAYELLGCENRGRSGHGDSNHHRAKR